MNLERYRNFFASRGPSKRTIYGSSTAEIDFVALAQGFGVPACGSAARPGSPAVKAAFAAGGPICSICWWMDRCRNNLASENKF